MIVTWTALRAGLPRPDCPWQPEGAVWSQSGHSADGRATMPSFGGRWWSVLAVWPDEASARAAAPVVPDVDAWHVVLQAMAYRGDATLADGATPFTGLPTGGRTTGASVVLTMAGFGDDAARTTEFFERFVQLGADVERAPGHRAALVQATDTGAGVTFSAWDTLRDAVTWAYHRPEHAATVHRQEEHPLVLHSGFLRCAVLASSGRLGDRPDPLDGRTGAVVVREDRP